MKLIRKISFIVMFVFVMLIILNVKSYAGTQRWNSLDYDVIVNSDGSMDVVETWNVYISETNTLFKDFEISYSDDYRIDDVKITKVENNEEIPLNQIYEEQYHVDSGCYYGLQIDSSTFEIAWNVGLDNSSASKIYKMYYTVENAVKIYNDCTEIYWQFLSDSNGMSGKNVTGTIRLPQSVSDIEKLRVWAHGDLTGEINKLSNKEIAFVLNSLRANEMLEIRVVTDENIYENCNNTYNKNMLEKILIEEQKWADEANKERENAQKRLERMKNIFIIVAIINVGVFLLFLSKIKEYKRIGKELKEEYLYPENELEYFRDIPDEENATPARALYMYRFNKKIYMDSEISNVFSATILNLSLKGLITFEPVSEKEIRIFRTPESQSKSVLLSEDELIIYNLLAEAMLGKDYITPKEFSKYASREYDVVYSKLNRIEQVVEKYHEVIGKTSTERKEIAKKWSKKFLIYMLLAIILSGFCFALPGLILGLIFMANACRKNSKYVSILTAKGNLEVAQWAGLKKYMEEYSLLKDKLVPDIVLWEKYLVYATVFGISKKVLKQLKAVHPELFNEANSNNFNRCGYWHMMNNPMFGLDSFEDFSKSLGNVYNSAKSAYDVAHSSTSSGSGGGGGFSSGGGGRRRRRKLRRTLIK